MRKSVQILIATLGVAVLPSPAFADRAPTAPERAALERALKAAGFINWEEIELDDDGPYWEVDDARSRDGRRYDLKLAPGTLKIVKRTLED